jgi:hypothetical protein
MYFPAITIPAVNMRIEIKKEEKACLETVPHSHEMLLTKKAQDAVSGSTMLLNGGSGKKVLVPAELSNYMRPSVDIDVIMPHYSAARAFNGMRKDRMVDRVKAVMVEGKLAYENVTYYSPFPVYRDGSYPDTDIFTTETGLGPISVTHEIFRDSIKVELRNSDVEVRIADIAFTLATSINPLVFTNTRARGSLVALFSNLEIFDVSDVAARAAGHLAASIERVDAVVASAMSDSKQSHIKSDKNYRSYADILSTKTPIKLAMLSKKLKKTMSKVGVGDAAVETGIKELSSELSQIKKLLRA